MPAPESILKIVNKNL